MRGDVTLIDNSGPGCTVTRANVLSQQEMDMMRALWQRFGFDKDSPVSFTQNGMAADNWSLSITRDQNGDAVVQRQ